MPVNFLKMIHRPSYWTKMILIFNKTRKRELICHKKKPQINSCTLNLSQQKHLSNRFNKFRKMTQKQQILNTNLPAKICRPFLAKMCGNRLHSTIRLFRRVFLAICNLLIKQTRQQMESQIINCRNRFSNLAQSSKLGMEENRLTKVTPLFHCNHLLKVLFHQQLLLWDHWVNQCPWIIKIV